MALSLVPALHFSKSMDWRVTAGEFYTPSGDDYRRGSPRVNIYCSAIEYSQFSDFRHRADLGRYWGFSGAFGVNPSGLLPSHGLSGISTGAAGPTFIAETGTASGGSAVIFLTESGSTWWSDPPR